MQCRIRRDFARKRKFDYICITGALCGLPTVPAQMARER